jgi:hypothetical protein
MRRASAFTALALAATVLALAVPGTAAADPAGPTDYRSEVVEVAPDVGTIDVAIAGGDSFVVIDVAVGTEVVVLGYQGEHYLRITADGDVWENRRSPATYENTERYGVGELPPEADASADPEWRRVGSGGSWAWHDHRAHRMDPFPPVNVDRGEQVLDTVVPLLVDGTEVDVRVSSTWMPAPSPVPAVIGLVVGAALVGLVGVLRRRPALALAIVAAPALVVGLVQFRSLPPATDPLWLWWLAPAISLVAAIAGVTLETRSPSRPGRPNVAALTALAIAALQLLIWGVERRHGLARAILPTDAPFWLDRFVSGAALAAGGAALLLVTWNVIAVLRTSQPAPARSPG